MKKLPEDLFYTFTEAAEIMGISLDRVIHFAETSQIPFHCLADWEYVEFGETKYRELTTITQKDFSALVAGQPIVLEGGPALSGDCAGCPTVKITYHPDPGSWVIDAELVRTLKNAASDHVPPIIKTKPSIIKATKANDNDFEFSGLLNIPKKVGDWFRAIDDMTRDYLKKHGQMPNEAQAWAQLCKNPPSGYEITTGKDKCGEDCLCMPNITPVSHSAFRRRWKKYTTNKSQ